MADKLMLLLQLALVCSVTIGFVSSAALDDEGTIIEEADEKDETTGSVVHDKREVDYRCRFEKNTNTKVDGTKNELLDDFADGKGIVMDSNSSEACYIRDISASEKKEADTCKEGMVERDAGKPDTESTDYDESKVPLKESEREELPIAIREACKDKTIYKLLLRPAGSDKDNGAASREKRALRRCWRVHRRYVCRIQCYYYFFRLRCYRRCAVYRYLYYVFC